MKTRENKSIGAVRSRRRRVALIILGGALAAVLWRLRQANRGRVNAQFARDGVLAGESRDAYIPALKFDWLTPLYDPVLTWVMREDTFKRHLVQQARIERGHRALDLGCGTATLTVMIKQLHPEAEVVGLDGDPRVLEIARVKAAKAGVDVRLDQGMAFALPYPDGALDRVLSSLLFHHLQQKDKKRTLREVFRVLRPGGELHVADLGKPQNGLMYAVALVMARFEEASDNIAGLLPEMMRGAGFEEVEETARCVTAFGTVALYRARKPG